jgi:hypothetical protein
MNWTTLMSTAAVVLTLTALAGPAAATPDLWAKAKANGFPAQNCQYCHVPAFPMKETFKPDDLNARGKWLMEEMQRQKAKSIDVEWLKKYPGGK